MKMGVWAVAQYTFLEALKSRVMLTIPFLVAAMVIVTLIAAEFAYGVPSRVALDFGFGLMSISLVAISVFMGVSLISREIETRTIYMILTKPLSRPAYFLGRLLGMIKLLFVNGAVLGGVAILLYLFEGGNYTSLLVWTMVFNILEACLLLMVVVCFSLVTNTLMTIFYSVSLYVIGYVLAETLGTVQLKANALFHTIVKVANFVLPDFSRFNFKSFLLYQDSLGGEVYLASFLYFICYFLFLFTASLLIFNKKNLD